MKNKGTPKTLYEAISSASQDPKDIEAAVRDYLAQKFTTSLMKCHSPTGDVAAAIEDLWTKITGEGI